MTFTIEHVAPDEIAEKARGKWSVITDNLLEAHELSAGIFIHPFAKSDFQNLSQSVRKGFAEKGLRLRSKSSTRSGMDGMYLWVERA